MGAVRSSCSVFVFLSSEKSRIVNSGMRMIKEKIIYWK